MNAIVFNFNRPFLAACLLALAVVAPTSRADPADPTDPFDPINKVLSPRTQAILDKISFTAKLSSATVKRGGVVRLTISGTPAAGFHTYPITVYTNEQAVPELAITYTGIDGIKPLWPIAESKPELALSIESKTPKSNEKKIVYEHGHPFEWSQDLLIDPQTKPGVHDLTVVIDNVEVCNKSGCSVPAPYRPLYVSFEVLEESVAPTKETLARLQVTPPTMITPTAEEIAKLKAKGADTVTPLPGTTGGVDVHNLWSFLWFAAISAFLMLLTPCVFPMIPITVNFFIKQSEKEHHKPLAMASVYSGTIIVLLTTIMLALGSVIIKVADNEYFNLGLGLVLVFFALSLFGMYEIELPHFLARFTSAREGQGGMIGAVFMAMTFTITSFTCTGPFLGFMLGSVAGVQPPMLNLVLGAVVYSTTFAAPFFVLALFPSVLKKLPKSGSWLNAVKVTMGFLELGAALKFLSNADFAFFPGNPQIFNYDTVLAAWIALSLSCGVYLLGLFRLPHDDKAESIGAIRMVIAVGFLGLSLYLAPAMFGIKPAGIIGDNLVAFLPVRTGHEGAASLGGDGSDNKSDGHDGWYKVYEDAWKDAMKNDKLIFMDFTGVNCSNCRYNEGSVFTLPQVKAEMNKFVKVALYTDTVPSKLTPSEAKQQAERNYRWHITLGDKDATRPYYIVFRPAHDEPLENGIPKGTVVAWAKGTIFDVPTFVGILQKSQTKTTAQLRVSGGN